MIYIVGIVGIVIVALLGALKMQDLRVNEAVARRDAAEAANKALAASIDGVRKQCAKAIADARRDADKRKAAAAAAAAAADKEAQAQQSTIATLLERAQTAQTSANNCANAEKILNDLARDRSR